MCRYGREVHLRDRCRVVLLGAPATLVFEVAPIVAVTGVGSARTE